METQGGLTGNDPVADIIDDAKMIDWRMARKQKPSAARDAPQPPDHIWIAIKYRLREPQCNLGHGQGAGRVAPSCRMKQGARCAIAKARFKLFICWQIDAGEMCLSGLIMRVRTETCGKKCELQW